MIAVFLERHPHWKFIQTLLTKGASMHLKEPVPSKIRRQENQTLISYNNHKGARDHEEIIHESINDDIIKGYAIALPMSAAHKLPKAMICPVRVVQQKIYSKDGSQEIKTRLTHDQTYTHLDNSKSVNDLLDLSKFPPMIYGWYLQ
jgi:hypothetical protein